MSAQQPILVRYSPRHHEWAKLGRVGLLDASLITEVRPLPRGGALIARLRHHGAPAWRNGRNDQVAYAVLETVDEIEAMRAFARERVA